MRSLLDVSFVWSKTGSKKYYHYYIMQGALPSDVSLCEAITVEFHIKSKLRLNPIKYRCRKCMKILRDTP